MTDALTYALTIVFVILIAYSYYEYCFEHVGALLWENKNSYINLLSKYGMPTALNPECGGGAVWALGNKQITLFDHKYGTEQEPTIHLWTPIKLFAPVNPKTVKVSEHGRQKRIADILDLLPRFMSYDPIKKQVMARFYNLQTAQVMTMMAMKLTTGELSLAKIRDDGLILQYAKKVTPGGIDYDPTVVRQVEQYIDRYVKCFC